MSTAHTRFWAKVEKTQGCWSWMGALSCGYGVFWDGARLVLSHRWSYENVLGPIPEGLQIDHLCRVRNCVRPAHLEPVTSKENIQRGLLGVLKESCGSGTHPWTAENIYVHKKTGKRQCRPCMRDRRIVYDAKNRDRINAQRRARRAIKRRDYGIPWPA